MTLDLSREHSRQPRPLEDMLAYSDRPESLRLPLAEVEYLSFLRRTCRLQGGGLSEAGIISPRRRHRRNQTRHRRQDGFQRRADDGDSFTAEELARKVEGDGLLGLEKFSRGVLAGFRQSSHKRVAHEDPGGARNNFERRYQADGDTQPHAGLFP